jgi:hypothetical protein
MLSSAAFPGLETIAAAFPLADEAFPISMVKFELYRNRKKRFFCRADRAAQQTSEN